MAREGPETEQEEGSDFPIRKVAPGGWSQRWFQQRVENTWEHNAHDVAEQAAKLAGTVDAKVVILSPGRPRGARAGRRRLS